MPCKPRDILEVARHLGLHPEVDSFARSCVSRSYYAALLSADQTFDASGKPRIDGESSHAEIIGRAVAYGNQVLPGRTDARLIAKALQRLRKLRNFCDYRIDEDFLDEDHRTAFVRAERIVEQCEKVGAAMLAAVPVLGPDANIPDSELAEKSEIAPARPGLVRIK